MAYIKKIQANTVDSHQNAGGANLLTFVRWANRDLTEVSNSEALELREPMLVVNDCIQLTVNQNKASHVQSATMIMASGDINYTTAVHSGDFVFINMLEDDSKVFGKNADATNATADSLYSRAKNKKPINRKDDGFKGLYRVQRVRRVFATDENGGKQLTFQIQAAAFTEFNQVIYFNSYLYDEKEREGDKFKLFNQVARDFTDQVTKEPLSIRSVFKHLIQYLIGQGFPPDFGAQKEEVTRNHNQNFIIPSDIGQLLGLGRVQRAADIFTYYNGIQNYRTTASTDEIGLNPVATRDGTFLNCGPSPKGAIVLIGEYWNQTVAWSLINQYINSTLNEIYTSFKLTPDGKVLPSVVLRQKPFSSKYFTTRNPDIEATEFLSIPRWHIDPNILFDYDLGQEEAARINFVQVIGKARGIPLSSELALQGSMQAFSLDEGDITRNGLRPYIVTCDFDFPIGKENQVPLQSPQWGKLIFDWLNNGHLRENGNIRCVGIVEPIAVGDNLQLGDTVYHIESIVHNITIGAEGDKIFTTSLALSFGTDVDSDATATLYPEMTYSDMNQEREYDYQSTGILSGMSDDQNVNKTLDRKGFGSKKQLNRKKKN